MRAVLRYRHIPFRWVPQGSQWDDMPPFPLIPVIGFPDAEGNYTDAQMDSSPLIMRLEGMKAGRSVVPTDPVVAFIDYLLEDYADEWVTKAMYHYRWYYDEAIAKAKQCPRTSGRRRSASSPSARSTGARSSAPRSRTGRRSRNRTFASSA
jgi:hypothetical protein